MQIQSCWRESFTKFYSSQFRKEKGPRSRDPLFPNICSLLVWSLVLIVPTASAGRCFGANLHRCPGKQCARSMFNRFFVEGRDLCVEKAIELLEMIIQFLTQL